MPTFLLNLPAPLRRALPGGRVSRVLVFLLCCLTMPRLASWLMTEHFQARGEPYLYVATRHGDSFDLVSLKTPATLPSLAFVANGDKPSPPNSAEATQRVRVLGQDASGTLVETAWSNDDYVITSRYRVTGLQVVPVSRRTAGIPQALLGFVIAVVVTRAMKFAQSRWRKSRDAQTLEQA